MNMKDLVCPLCGRSNISFPLIDDNYQLNLDSDEDIDYINFNDNNNNLIFNISNDPNYEPNEIEQKNKMSISNFSVDNFNFSIIDAKNNLTNNINQEEKKNSGDEVQHPKRLGRKTKRNPETNLENDNSNNNNNNSNVHNKFSDDNIKKKCKNLVLKCILEFINNKIKLIYNNDIGHGDSEKNLKTLKEESTKTSTADSYCKFMNKKLKDIFSQKISTKYCNFSPLHNKKIIDSLVEEKDDAKKSYFVELFNLTFSDCLKHFRGDTCLEELKGFKNLDSVKDEIVNKCEEKGEEYFELFAYYIKNYEKLVNKKTKKSGKDLDET